MNTGHVASICWDSEFGRYRGNAGLDQVAPVGARVPDLVRRPFMLRSIQGALLAGGQQIAGC